MHPLTWSCAIAAIACFLYSRDLSSVAPRAFQRPAIRKYRRSDRVRWYDPSSKSGHTRASPVTGISRANLPTNQPKLLAPCEPHFSKSAARSSREVHHHVAVAFQRRLYPLRVHVAPQNAAHYRGGPRLRPPCAHPPVNNQFPLQISAKWSSTPPRPFVSPLPKIQRANVNPASRRLAHNINSRRSSNENGPQLFQWPTRFRMHSSTRGAYQRQENYHGLPRLQSGLIRLSAFSEPHNA